MDGAPLPHPLLHHHRALHRRRRASDRSPRRGIAQRSLIALRSGTTTARDRGIAHALSRLPTWHHHRPSYSKPPIALLKICARLAAVLFDISQLLQTGLDRKSLETLVGLTECGVNPEALASVVKELRRESAALRAAEEAVEAAGASGSAPDASTR